MKMFLIKKPWCSAQGFIGALLLALIAFAVVVGDARAEEINFTAPQTLRGGDVVEPQVAVDPQGRATIVWEELGPEKLIWIQAQRVDPNGLPGPIQTLAKSIPASPSCPCPQVVVDSSGRATVAWQAVVGEYRRIQATQIDAGGTAGPVYTFSPPEVEGWDQRLVVDAEGRATLVWRTPSLKAVESVRFGVDGAPEEVQALAEGVEGLGLPAVGVGPEGKATVVWPTDEGLRMVQIDAGGTPGPTREISPSDNADGVPHVVVDSNGRATIAWWRGLGNYEARSVRLDPEGVPGTVQTLSLPGEGNGAFDPRLAVDSQDRVTAVWQTFSERIYAVRLDESGAPETVYPLSSPDREAGEPQLAAAPDGQVIVVWAFPPPVFAPEEGCLEEAEFDPASDVVQAAFLGPGGEPERVVDISPFGEQSLVPKVGVNALGLPTVVWESFDGTYFCEDFTTRIQMSRGLPVEPKPEPEPDPPPPPPPAPAGNGILRLNGKATAREQSLHIHVSCTEGACAGQVKFVHSRLVFARGRFQLAAGQSKTLALALTGFGKQLGAKGSGRLLRTIGRGSGVNKHVVWVRLRGHPH
jgi:hypothetical protein